MQTIFLMKYLGFLSYFLGIEVTPTQGGLLLHQTKYFKELFHKAGLVDCKPIPTLIGSKYVVLTKTDKKPYEDSTHYRSLVRALQYRTITKPKIQFAVNILCQKMHEPTNGDYAALKRILRYVKGILTQGLLFTLCPLILAAYSNSG